MTAVCDHLLACSNWTSSQSCSSLVKGAFGSWKIMNMIQYQNLHFILNLCFLPWRDVFWDTDDISVTGPPEVTKSLEWSALFRVQSHTEVEFSPFFLESPKPMGFASRSLARSLGAKKLQNDGISSILTLVDALLPSARYRILRFLALHPRLI